MALNSLSFIAGTCCRLWTLIKHCVRASIIGVHAENISKIVRLQNSFLHIKTNTQKYVRKWMVLRLNWKITFNSRCVVFFFTTDAHFWRAWIMWWWIVSSRRVLPEYSGLLFTYSQSWKSEEIISDKIRGRTPKPKCLRTSIVKKFSLFQRGQITWENFPNIVDKGHRYCSSARISWTWLLWRLLHAILQGLSVRNYRAGDSV